MNKKEKEVALSKLTIEEQELLGLIKKPKAPRVKKNHKLKVYYMIGDADGSAHEEVIISANNPFLKIVTGALDKLRGNDNYYTIALHEECYGQNNEAGNIDDLEHDLLCLLTSCDFYDEDVMSNFLQKYELENTEQTFWYLQEFEGLLTSSGEWHSLTYEGYKLK
jgi:hypothetical protein